MKPAFVIDCSIALAWCFLDEATSATQKLLDRMAGESALVPGLWFVELTNVLALAERRGRINSDQVIDFVAMISGLRLEVDDEGPARAFTHLLPLCRAHGLTSYDAVYLDLAMRRRAPLATLDVPLRKAAKKLAVKVLGQ
jgi:predicted nucleic acid-binding protein